MENVFVRNAAKKLVQLIFIHIKMVENVKNVNHV
jgi:hypothetical protein